MRRSSEREKKRKINNKKNNKNIRKLKYDRSVWPAEGAVPESWNPMYHAWRKISN